MEVRAVVWQSEGCRFDPTLDIVLEQDTRRAIAPGYFAWQPITIGVWLCEWEA